MNIQIFFKFPKECSCKVVRSKMSSLQNYYTYYHTYYNPYSKDYWYSYHDDPYYYKIRVSMRIDFSFCGGLKEEVVNFAELLFELLSLLEKLLVQLLRQPHL